MPSVSIIFSFQLLLLGVNATSPTSTRVSIAVQNHAASQPCERSQIAIDIIPRTSGTTQTLSLGNEENPLAASSWAQSLGREENPLAASSEKTQSLTNAEISSAIIPVRDEENRIPAHKENSISRSTDNDTNQEKNETSAVQVQPSSDTREVLTRAAHEVSTRPDEFSHQCVFCFETFQDDVEQLQETYTNQNGKSGKAVSAKEAASAKANTVIITPCGHKFHIACLRKDMTLKLVAKARTTGVNPLSQGLAEQRRNREDQDDQNTEDQQPLMQCPHPFCQENLSKSWALNHNEGKERLIDIRMKTEIWKEIIKGRNQRHRLANGQGNGLGDREPGQREFLYTIWTLFAMIVLVVSGLLVLVTLKLSSTF